MVTAGDGGGLVLHGARFLSGAVGVGGGSLDGCSRGRDLLGCDAVRLGRTVHLRFGGHVGGGGGVVVGGVCVCVPASCDGGSGGCRYASDARGGRRWRRLWGLCAEDGGNSV